jgi:hypothetical protein
VAPVVDDAEEEEERAGRDAVVDHLEHAALDRRGRRAKRPSITYPRCATDEYAMRRFTSSCFHAQSAP